MNTETISNRSEVKKEIEPKVEEKLRLFANLMLDKFFEDFNNGIIKRKYGK